MSASTVARLKLQWGQEYQGWCARRLDQDQWVYLWVDGIYSGLRAEDTKLHHIERDYAGDYCNSAAAWRCEMKYALQLLRKSETASLFRCWNQQGQQIEIAVRHSTLEMNWRVGEN